VSPFINRLAEHATKLAMILAVGEPRVGHAVIDLRKWKWSRELARHCVGEMVANVSEHVSDNEREEVYKKVAAIIQKAGKKGVTAGRIINLLPPRYDGRLRESVIHDLVQGGRVEDSETVPPNGGKRSHRYRWIR
jgi:hypothetical protein